ncbi:unnamed protein product [Arctia plantaginis]|uniref:Uncharacterized protein n=1 Tax=Arctia plantaginis TaxID=874455 RepID=A0A8S1BJS2_ARCPL|nr:unnamed protein product [Arctia plantaginis]CAB3260334.1 unnamed protein product [Arctia plantaginis]
MAMVVSRKSKCCLCSLFLLMILGISLAVVSTLNLFEPKKEHHQVVAEMYSQTKSAPRVVEMSTVSKEYGGENVKITDSAFLVFFSGRKGIDFVEALIYF